MDLGQQPADPVRQPGRLLGLVVVEADQHGQLRQCLLTDVDPPQRVRQGPCGVGDDIGVAGVGLGLPGVQVGDPTHRQPRQIGHVDAHLARDRDRERADRGRLVDHKQDPAVPGEAGQHAAQRGLVVGQGLVMQPGPVDVERARVVLALTDVQPDEHRVRRPPRLVRTRQLRPPSLARQADRDTRAGSHVTSRPH